MAQLLEVDKEGNVEVAEWVRLNPAFEALYVRDRLPPNQRPKFRARVWLNFIRMMWNPNSEYQEYAEKDRLTKVLQALKIDKSIYEVEELVHHAEAEYKDILSNFRYYRAWKAASTSLDNKIVYLETYVPGGVDKQGKLLLTPEQHSKAVKAMLEDMSTIETIKGHLEKEMQQEIRTKSTLRLGLDENKKIGFAESNVLL